MFDQIQHSLVNIQLPLHIQHSPVLTRFHQPHDVIQIQGHTDIYGYSFFPHVVRLWNTLPVSIALSPSLMTFQTGLQGLVFTPPAYLMRL